jgi:hypothetical protein
VVGGTFALSFWITVGSLVLAAAIPFVMYLRRTSSIGWLVAAGLLANLAAVLKRLLIVVPSQTHGGLLQLREGLYTPTWVEAGVVLGAAGLLVLAILIFGRFFPLAPTPVDPARRAAALPREPVRALATLACVLAAAALIAIGLSDSFRMWSHGELDPRLPFSPAIFATGVILLFSSAIVYETFPAPRRTPPARARWRRHAGIRRVDVRTHQLRSSRDPQVRRKP